jgi:hypothetical protein
MIILFIQLFKIFQRFRLQLTNFNKLLKMRLIYLLSVILFFSCKRTTSLNSLRAKSHTVENPNLNAVSTNDVPIKQEIENEKFYYQTELFDGINLYRQIKDTAAFINDLKLNCHLFWDTAWNRKESIVFFKKIKVFGSDDFFYFIQYDFEWSSNAEFPGKNQMLFNKKGKLLACFYDVWIDTVTILKNENPFLFGMTRTAHGNGGHYIYKIQSDTIESVYGAAEEPTYQTYASGYGLFEYIPYELQYKIYDENKDGLNDVIFYGNVRYSTYDLGHTDDKVVPVELIFLYDLNKGHFIEKQNYKKKYRFIFAQD